MNGIPTGTLRVVGLFSLCSFLACQQEGGIASEEQKILTDLERREQIVLSRGDLPHDPDLVAVARRFVTDRLSETGGAKPRVFVVSAVHNGDDWYFSVAYYRDERYVDKEICVSPDGKSVKVMLSF